MREEGRARARRAMTLALGLGLAALLPLACMAAAETPRDCHVGAYRLQDGRVVDLGPSGAGLKWRMVDGRMGRIPAQAGESPSTLGNTSRADGHRLWLGGCGEPIRFDDMPAGPVRLLRQDTRFQSRGVSLAGRLVLPPGDAPVPVVVLVHGSEAVSALRYNAWQRLLPAHGIGVFVYDKRGTGDSQGTYTQDFAALADDAAAAAREARRLAGLRMAELVYEGGSQGGWVAPLAHAREPAQRVVVGYGLTVSPLEENRSEALQDLRLAGFDETAVAAAAELVDATGELMASGFRSGFRRYGQLRRKHRDAPWFGHLHGEFTGQLLAYPGWLLRLVAPWARKRSDRGTPWRHQPLPVLAAAGVPMLWVLAGEDTMAPPEQTRRDLLALHAEGHAVTVLEFPDTEHGIEEFEVGADGKRVRTRGAEGYLDAVMDFVRDGRLGDRPYGRAQRLTP